MLNIASCDFIQILYCYICSSWPRLLVVLEAYHLSLALLSFSPTAHACSNITQPPLGSKSIVLSVLQGKMGKKLYEKLLILTLFVFAL